MRTDDHRPAVTLQSSVAASSSRRWAAAQYAGSISMPIASSPIVRAAISVLPMPANGSSTTAPADSAASRRHLSGNSTGNVAGRLSRSAALCFVAYARQHLGSAAHGGAYTELGDRLRRISTESWAQSRATRGLRNRVSVAFTVATQAGKNTISSTIQTVADRT